MDKPCNCPEVEVTNNGLTLDDVLHVQCYCHKHHTSWYIPKPPDVSETR